MEAATHAGARMNDEMQEPSTAREAIVVFVAAICLMLVQLMPLRSLSMLARPLWLDECVTDLIVREPSMSKAYGELLAGGVDANPPAYYALMRSLAAVGLHSPSMYRATALLCVAGALAGVYAILRRSFDRFSSSLGVLSMWGIAVVVEHTFEARFYGLLLLATVWFAFFASRVECGNVARFMLGLAAVVACTTHWFGVVGIALVLIGESIARYRDRRSIRPLWPAAAGLVALLACLPLLIAQKNAIGSETFVGGNPLRAAFAYYMLLLPGGAIATLAAVVMLERLCAAPDRRATHQALKPLLGLFMLSLMPVALVVISLLLQPVMQLRYAIVAAAAMAVPAALIAARIDRAFWRGVAVVAVVLVSFNALFRVWLEKKTLADEVAAFTNVARDAAGKGMNTLFELRHDHYPAVWAAPSLGESCYFLNEPLNEESRLHAFERIMAERVERLAGAPKTITLAAAGNRFIFIAESTDAARVMKFFPDAAVEPLGGRAFRITR
jgi:hypothetical protein